MDPGRLYRLPSVSSPAFRRGIVVFSVVALVAIAGCTAPLGPSEGNETTPTPTTTPRDDVTPPAGGESDGSPDDGNGTNGPGSGGDGTPRDPATPTPTPDPNADLPGDPPADGIGYVEGYWYNQTLDVDPSDGYDEAELDAVVRRTMARVERIRGLDFQRNVSLRTITREEFRDRGLFEFEEDPWKDVIWRALFTVDGETSAAAELEEVYGGGVAGYYLSDRITLVTEGENVSEIDRGTLAHELAHALQDQHFGVTGTYRGTLDGQSAGLAVPEGEANYVMDRYQERCDAGWVCIPGGGGGSNRSYNEGMFVTVFLPYSEGPKLVAALRDRDGWEAVDRAWDDRPVSTSQVIHPGKYPNETPTTVTIPDRSNADWERFNSRNGQLVQRVGEAALFSMLWYNGVVPDDHLRAADSRYNYTHPSTAGWAGDALIPYRSDEGYGYVFESAWESEADAREFHGAYLDLLDGKGASEVETGVYRIPDAEPFAGGYRVVQEGEVVRVVHAPTVEALDAVHESAVVPTSGPRDRGEGAVDDRLTADGAVLPDVRRPLPALAATPG